MFARDDNIWQWFGIYTWQQNAQSMHMNCYLLLRSYALVIICMLRCYVAVLVLHPSVWMRISCVLWNMLWLEDNIGWHHSLYLAHLALGRRKHLHNQQWLFWQTKKAAPEFWSAPTRTRKINVKSVFLHKSKSNWLHPLQILFCFEQKLVGRAWFTAVDQIQTLCL